MNVSALHSQTDRALSELDGGDVDVQRVNARLRIVQSDLSVHRMAFAIAKLTGEQLGIAGFLGEGKQKAKATR